MEDYRGNTGYHIKVSTYPTPVEAECQAAVHYVMAAQLPLHSGYGPDDGSSYKHYEEDAKHDEGALLRVGQIVFSHPLLLYRGFYASPIRRDHEGCLILDCFIC